MLQKLEGINSELAEAPSTVGQSLLRVRECLYRIQEVGGDDAAASNDLEEWLGYFVELVQAWAAGEDVSSMVPPEQSGPAAAIDPDLLGSFLSSCTESLTELEDQLLRLEDGQAVQDFDEIRRRMHTIKGECGVLSLHVAQELCHYAEDFVTRAQQANFPLTADPLLRLVDWLRAMLRALEADSSSAPQDYQELLEELKRLASLDHAASVPLGQANAEEESGAEKVSGGLENDEPVMFSAAILEDETLPDFLEESNQHLDDCEAILLEMDQADGIDEEAINRLFRVFHTIKGVAGFYDLDCIVRLAHSTEALMDEFRKGNLTCNQNHLNLVFKSRDLMARLLGALVGQEAPMLSELNHLVAQLQKEIDGKGAAAAAAPRESVAAPKRPSPTEPTEAVQAEKEPVQASAAPQGEAAATSSQGATDVVPPAKDAKGSSAEKTDSGKEQGAKAAAATSKKPGEAAPAPKRKVQMETSVKVSTQRMDALVDMVGELVISQQMVLQHPDIETLRSQRLNRNLSQMAKITRDLQESAMSLRMVTLKPTFQKMARLVRDVSGKAGRLVKLQVTGEDTELDRTVVEEISDPLIHLLRNAVDHGIEPPDEREEAGKPKQGTVHLRAYHQGGSIVIDIQDDGRGLNREKILEKAIEKGILGAEARRSDMSDGEVFRLIFQPGFSTAAKVTDISGRGVGMDVVRKNIESMRGKIEITSEFGKGSTISLRLPLTLAIIDGMIVRVGEDRFVIPTLAIEQSFRPSDSQVRSVLRNEMVNVRGNMLSVHRLSHLLSTPGRAQVPGEGILIILDSSSARGCVLVDEILGQQQVVIKSLGKAVPKLAGISGGAILGDGRVALILDVDTLLQPMATAHA